MRRAKIVWVSITLVLLVVLLSGCLQPRLSYQGRLTDTSGNAVPDGAYQVTFRLYGPNPLLPWLTIEKWEETQTVTVTSGLFNVDLGSVKAITPSLFTGPLELGVEVEGDGEMAPRMSLTGAPYAMTLVDGAVMLGTVNLDSPDYPGMLNVSNMGSGYGIGVGSMGKAGIAITGQNILSGAPTGLYGFIVDQVLKGGIITNTQGIGLNIYNLGATGTVQDDDDAIRARSTSDGIVGITSGTGNADNGVWGQSQGGVGIYGWKPLTDTNWAGYFVGDIYTSQSCTNCAIRYVARNTSGVVLQPGDAVGAAGVEVVQGIGNPVMKVAPAASGRPILGVVVGRAEVTTILSESDNSPIPHISTVEGSAAPGDYLVIVVQGPAQVRVDPAAGVEAGSLVYLGAAGVTAAAAGQPIGMALDVPDADGLVWVLVGFR